MRRPGRVDEGKVKQGSGPLDARQVPISGIGASPYLRSTRSGPPGLIPSSTGSPFIPTSAMTFFGIQLRRPSFNEVTAATVMAVGLWVAVIGLAQVSGHALQARDAGALLVVSVWGCIGVRVGVSLGKGGRHLAAHVGVSAVLLAIYQGALVLAS
jgi:hypothetical protein